MRIERLDLIAFGHFSEVSLDLSAGPRQFHLVYGPNESGKSTSLRAISALLFGMPHVADDSYLHPNSRLRVGGVLSDEHGRRLECVRRRGRKATLRDASDSEAIDDTVLTSMLAGLDRETFARQYGLSHEELTAGGEAVLRGDGDLGELLFAAGAGLSRLHEIQCALEEASRDLFVPRGNRTINAAIKRIDEQRKQLRSVQLPPAEFLSVKRRMEQKRERAKQLEDSLQSLAGELARLRACKQAWKLLPRWQHENQALEQSLSTPLLDESFSERRRRVESDLELTIRQLADFEQRIETAASRLEGLTDDAAVMAHGGEIERLFQELAARDKADRDRSDLRRLQQRMDRQIGDLLRELSVEILTDDEAEQAELIDDSVERLRISDSLRTRINELAASYERLMQQRDDARQEWEVTERRLAELDLELDAFGTPADVTSLSNAIDEVGSPGTILEALAELEQDFEGLRQECQRLVDRLPGTGSDFEAAARLNPPSQEEVEQAARAIDGARQRQQATRDRIRQLRQQREQVRQDLERLRRTQPLPTDQELREQRDRRDRWLDELIRAEAAGERLEDGLTTLRDKIASADRVVDTIRLHHREVHQRASSQQQLDAIEQQLESLEDEVQQQAMACESASQHWQKLWEDCQITAQSPERMKPWLSVHRELARTVDRCREQRARLDKGRQRIERHEARLRAAMASAGLARVAAGNSDPTSSDRYGEFVGGDLLTLFDEAVEARGQLADRLRRYEDLRRRRDELADQLPIAESKLQLHERNVRQWRDDWRTVTVSFTSDESATPTVAMAMVRQIDELCDKKRERDILATRIRSIGEDDDDFRRRVERIANAVGIDAAAEAAPETIVHTFYQRLKVEREAVRERQALRRQIEEAAKQCRELEQSRASCEAAIRQLCREAGCEDPAELPQRERRSRERRLAEDSVRGLREQLAELAAGQPIDEFVERASEQDPELLEINIQRTEAALKDVRKSISDVDQELGSLRHQLQAMDGGSQASELAQSIQSSAAAIIRDAEEYARLRVAARILRQAIEHYRRENQSPVLHFAQQIFSKLTCGEYQSLKVDFDAKGRSILLGVRGGMPQCGSERDARETGPVEVPAAAMSNGTADALYLSLRLASLRHQLEQGAAIPLIIDDCLMQLDDRRCVAALQVLSELSEKTQVILFTHHRHLVELARTELAEDGCHRHELRS